MTNEFIQHFSMVHFFLEDEFVKNLIRKLYSFHQFFLHNLSQLLDEAKQLSFQFQNSRVMTRTTLHPTGEATNGLLVTT